MGELVFFGVFGIILFIFNKKPKSERVATLSESAVRKGPCVITVN
jgi:hypothetical protein